MKGCTNDYSANVSVSDFLAGVEKFVWGNIDPYQEYTLHETLEELTTQFRRVSEEEQFVGDVITKWAGVPEEKS